MLDRRSHPRFNLRLPVSVFGKSGQEKPQGMRVYTRDISTGGAFLEAVSSAPGDGEISLVLHFSCLLGYGADMTAQAQVVRQEPGGLAVTFTVIDAQPAAARTSQ